MNISSRLAVAAVTGLVLTACGEQSATDSLTRTLQSTGQDAFGCSDPIAGGGTRIEFAFPSQCSNCVVANEYGAIDGDRTSAAYVNMALESATRTLIRVTAQEGRVFPAGGDAGAMFRFSGGEVLSESPAGPLWRIVIRTYLDGVPNPGLHEAGSSFRVGPSEDSASRRLYIYTQALQPFDAVEVEFAGDVGSLRQSFELYEVCGDF